MMLKKMEDYLLDEKTMDAYFYKSLSKNEIKISKATITEAIKTYDLEKGTIRSIEGYLGYEINPISALREFEQRLTRESLSINELCELIQILLTKTHKGSISHKIFDGLKIEIAWVNTDAVFRIFNLLNQHNLLNRINLQRVCAFNSYKETLSVLEVMIQHLHENDKLCQKTFDFSALCLVNFLRDNSFPNVFHLKSIPIYLSECGALENKELMSRFFNSNHKVMNFISAITTLHAHQLLNNLYLSCFINKECSEMYTFKIAPLLSAFKGLIHSNKSVNDAITNLLQKNQGFPIINGLLRLHQVGICKEENIASIAEDPSKVKQIVDTKIRAHLNLDNAHAHNQTQMAKLPEEIWQCIFSFFQHPQPIVSVSRSFEKLAKDSHFNANETKMM